MSQFENRFYIKTKTKTEFWLLLKKPEGLAKLAKIPA
jgi:hypothetical protein